MAANEAPCEHCGAVLPLAQLLRLDRQGGYVLTCPDCAIELPPAKGR